MDIHRLDSSITWNREEFGHHDLSVWSFPDLYADEIVRVSRVLNEGDPPHGKMQTATARAILTTGCELLRTELHKPGHYSIRFASAPSQSDLRILMGAFNHPRPTPSGDENALASG